MLRNAEECRGTQRNAEERRATLRNAKELNPKRAGGGVESTRGDFEGLPFCLG